MSLEIQYGRPYQRNESESLQKIIVYFVRYDHKSKYP